MGFRGVFIFYFFICSKHKLWVFVKTALLTPTNIHNLKTKSEKQETIRIFNPKNATSKDRKESLILHWYVNLRFRKVNMTNIHRAVLYTDLSLKQQSFARLHLNPCLVELGSSLCTVYILIGWLLKEESLTFQYKHKNNLSNSTSLTTITR